MLHTFSLFTSGQSRENHVVMADQSWLVQQFVDKFAGVILPRNQKFCVHGTNYQRTLATHLNPAAIGKIIEWLNPNSKLNNHSIKDGYFYAELYPGEHLHAPISILPGKTQSVAWDFIVEDDDNNKIDLFIDVVLPDGPNAIMQQSWVRSLNKNENMEYNCVVTIK